MRLAHAGRFDEALPYLEQAHYLSPTDLGLLHALANVLQRVGRFHQAIARYAAAAAKSPDNPEVLCGWARAWLVAGDPTQAREKLSLALDIDPAVANPGAMLDMIATELKDTDAACELLAQLVASHPTNAQLQLHHACLLRDADRLGDARIAYARYASLRPDDPMAHVELARLAINSGDRTGALESLQTALDIDPDNGYTLWEQSQIAGNRLDAATLEHVRALTAAETDPEKLIALNDLFARNHDAAGEYDLAARHLIIVKALQRGIGASRDPYLPIQREHEADLMIQFVTRTWMESMRGRGNPDPSPIFVVGMPRSGTTLLQQMLSSHPEIVGIGEQTFAESSFRRALRNSGNLPIEEMPASVLREAADWHWAMIKDRVGRLGLRDDAARIIDKLPDNFVHLGWLSVAFPNATLIHCLRDPRDVAISCWRAQFSRINWTLELDHIAHRIEQHRRIMRHWRAALGTRLVELRYETLVADPEAQLRRLLAAIKLDWHPDVLAHANRKGYVRTASQYQVDAAVTARSIGHWRHYEEVLRPILPRLEAIVAQDAREATADLRLP
ncbi:MAG: sulfotransferase [Proteobacteria bacterium]|nr:sulfotransferase [Pseudomonadota bacterium]